MGVAFCGMIERNNYGFFSVFCFGFGLHSWMIGIVFRSVNARGVCNEKNGNFEIQLSCECYMCCAFYLVKSE
jgi:hypothetical protein